MIPIQESLKPKSLFDLPADIETKSDSEDSSEDETEEEEEEIDYEVMLDNPKELEYVFGNLYWEFCRDTEMYDKSVLMLDELEEVKCLTKEECNAVNEHLQKKNLKLGILILKEKKGLVKVLENYTLNFAVILKCIIN